MPKYFKVINQTNKLVNFILLCYLDIYTFITTYKAKF